MAAYEAQREELGLAGTYRTFGDIGPMYEILEQYDEKQLWIRVFHSGEELSYLISEAVKDPIA